MPARVERLRKLHAGGKGSAVGSFSTKTRRSADESHSEKADVGSVVSSSSRRPAESTFSRRAALEVLEAEPKKSPLDGKPLPEG